MLLASVLSLLPSAVSVAEGDPASFTVRLAPPTIEEVVTVHYRTVAGTAQPGQDYVEVLDGMLTFDFGETEQFFQIMTLGSSTYKGDETFSVELFDPAPMDMTIDPAAGQSTVTILGTPPDLSINDVTVIEGDAGTSTDAVFTVTLVGESEVPATVLYATANGTAIAGEDYVPVMGQLSFAPGVKEQQIRVPILGNFLPAIRPHLLRQSLDGHRRRDRANPGRRHDHRRRQAGRHKRQRHQAPAHCETPSRWPTLRLVRTRSPSTSRARAPSRSSPLDAARAHRNGRH